MEVALESLGHPERRYKVLHVAGTNGKGSICAMLEACLAPERRTGMYTSPHLIEPTERIRTCGVDIAPAALDAAIEHVVGTLGIDFGFTYFELMTLSALTSFAESNVEVAILETGMGGRLDATNACSPWVSAISRIDLDHVAELGATREAIAAEKAGIFKSGRPAVTAKQEPGVLQVLQRIASDRSCRLRAEERDFSIRDGTFRGEHVRIGGLALPLVGAHQWSNLSVALATLEAALGSDFARSAAEIPSRLMQTRWPGRLEVIQRERDIVLDGAHNEAGIASLVAALDDAFKGREVHAVFGALSDKPVEAMVAALAPRCARFILSPVDSDRAMDPESMLAIALRHRADAEVVVPLQSALREAIRGCPREGLVLVAGSLYLVGKARGELV